MYMMMMFAPNSLVRQKEGAVVEQWGHFQCLDSLYLIRIKVACNIHTG